MQDISRDILEKHVETALPHADCHAEHLLTLGQLFLEAHERAPGGLTLEVGTRAGGSALFMLLLLRELYGEEAPFLITVDPYGSKPYVAMGQLQPWRYDDQYYLNQRRVLAPFPNHTHFFMTSAQFLRWAGSDPAPVFWERGEEREYKGFSFVFLDGEHDYLPVKRDLDLLEEGGLLAPGAIVYVDNTEYDAALLPYLMDNYNTQIAHGGTRAVLYNRR